PNDAGVPSNATHDASSSPDLDGDLGDAGFDGIPEAPPNRFGELLGVTDDEVSQRIEDKFQQLFHGDPTNEAIYVESSDTEAYIYDKFHDDTRMDAIGYGMMISVELNHQTEFDKLWTFAHNHLQFTTGAKSGYFVLTCPTTGEGCAEDIATMGTFFAVTALLFAEARWGDGPAPLDYGVQARAVLNTMLHKEDAAGVVDGVTNAFNSESHLPASEPTTDRIDQTMPGSNWPALYAIWAQRSEDPMWRRVTKASRQLLINAAHPTTGLYPKSTDASGKVITGAERFDQDTFGAALSLALDQSWFGADPKQIEIADRWLGFFDMVSNGLKDSYPSAYTYSGEPDSTTPSLALMAMNGSIAGISTLDVRTSFIRVVWEASTPVGEYRYFDGVTQLVSLMYLGGVLKAY
ncbi:MAG TPA: glycosyl hydrolase family 8, partial [Polyangiaceae bacterium]|nr:glycosyl hydrolase family 8 [Polyangiaceae bacterium]